MRIGWMWPGLLVALAAGALLTFVAILEAEVGPLGAPAPPQAPLTAVIVSSAATSAHFAGVPGADPKAHADRVWGWREALRARGIESRTIGDAELERGDIPETLVVLPSVAVLSDRAAARLPQLVAEGHALLATWQLGLVRPDGARRGPEVLETLFGVLPLASADVPRPRYFALRAGSPLAAGLPAGARVEIQPLDAPVPVAAPVGDGDWVRWELLPLGEPGAPVPLAAVAHRRIGRGRAVWFNFEPHAATAASIGARDALLGNALAWLGGRPLVAADLWPDGARTAALFALDTEHQFGAARTAVELLGKARVPPTFFCVSDLARSEPETFATLVRTGEIGSHTDDHRVLAGRPAAEQERHLAASAAALRALGAPRVEGFRPPEEQTDAHTLGAAARAGYTYVAGTGEKDRSEPSITPEGLVLLPRIPNDDFHWVVKQNGTDAAVLVRAARAELAHVARLGGLWFFSFHTQTLDSPALRTLLADLLEATRRPDVWRADGATIAAWWRRRDGVALRVEPVRGTRLRLRVTAKDAVPAIGVTVFLPGDDGHPVVVRPEQGPAPTDVRTSAEPDPKVHLRLEDLRAGETRVFHLDRS
jgi:peptidoglycan/xylan/chitin deacetylase (PgdA/CDA1 family)